jgi:hypothetical protein
LPLCGRFGLHEDFSFRATRALSPTVLGRFYRDRLAAYGLAGARRRRAVEAAMSLSPIWDSWPPRTVIERT